MNNWELNIKQGEWFETHVAKEWLKKHMHDWWITDARNHMRFSGKGPRLQRNSEEITIPDFRLDQSETGVSKWLDAKMKSKPFTLPNRPGERFYSLDPKTYRDYIKLSNVFKHMQFEILLGCAYTNLLLIFDIRTSEPVIHVFNNQYVRNNNNATPCFSTKDMKVVGRWNSSLLPK